MLVVVERSLRWTRVVLGSLQPLLELAIEQLALLALGAKLLLEALLSLGRPAAELVERGAEIVHRPRRGRRLVRDDRPQLGVERELGLAARTLDRERRCGHWRHASSVSEGRQAVRQCQRWPSSPTSSRGRAAATTPFKTAAAATSSTITPPGAGGTPPPAKRFAASTFSSNWRHGKCGPDGWCTMRSR